MAEQRFGIFGKDVTRYIPPELRPFTKLAVDMNPVTGFQRAGQALKEGDYGESALETGILALPAGAYALRNVIKPSVTAGVDALKELFLLGASDDVVKKAPKVDTSKRDFITKAPVALAATAMVPPVLKDVGDIISTPGAAKLGKTALSSSAIIAKSRDLASQISDGMIESLFKKTKKAEKLNTEQLKLKTAEYNKTLSDFLKDQDYDKLIKLPKNDLADLYNQKNFSAYEGAGDPLRSKEYGPLLDKVFKDRGIGLDSQGNYKKLLRNEGDPLPKNYLDDPDELMAIFDKRDLFRQLEKKYKVKKMLPSNVQEELYPLWPRNFKKEETAYHFTFPEKIPGYQDKFKKLDIKQFDLDVAEARNKGYSEKYADTLGIHVGSDKAARDRFYSVTGKTDEGGTALEEKGQTYPLKIDTSKPFLNPNSIDGSGLWSETELENYLFDEFFKDEKFRDIIEDNLSGG